MNDRQLTYYQALARTGDLFGFHVYHMGREPWMLHKDVFQYLETGIDPGLVDPPEPTADRFVGIPPGFGKSTIIETVITKTLAFDRNFRWIIGSKASTRAVVMARNVRFHLEYNRRIMRDFGTFRGPKWTEAEFQVSGRDARITHPSVRAVGTDTATLGSRGDGFVGDDLLDLDNTRTEHMRSKFFEWVTKIALSRLDPAGGRPWPYGAANTIGNILNPRDWYNQQIKTGRVSPFLRRAYIDEARKIATLPEMYPIDALKAAYNRVGHSAFEVLFMLNLKGAEGAAFLPEWKRWWTTDPTRVSDLVRFLPPLHEMTIVQGWDLAGGEDEKEGAYAVGVTLGIENRTGHVFVLDIWRKRVDAGKQAEAVIALGKKWNPIWINVEKNFGDYVRKVAAADPWIGRKIQTPTSRGNKIDRIKFGLQPTVQNGRFHFAEPGHGQEDAEDEFYDFPSGDTVDVPDAVEIALRNPVTSMGSEVPVLMTEERLV